MLWSRVLGGIGMVALVVMGAGCSNDPSEPAPVPSSVVAVSGNNQIAQYSQAAALPLVVQVNDADSAPVAGATVNWSVTGGGTVSAATSVTNSLGQTSVTRTVGGTMSGYTTIASLPGDTAATAYFATLGTAVPSTYGVEVVFLTPVTATQRAAFLDAAARWSSIVVANFPADTIVADSASCGNNTPPMDSVVITSVLIYATIAPIDGPLGILGGA